MTVTISRGFADQERTQAAALFWQAFAAKLGKVMGPDEKGLAFFEIALNPDFALVARDKAGRMLGLAGFKTRDGSFAGGTAMVHLGATSSRTTRRPRIHWQRVLREVDRSPEGSRDPQRRIRAF